MARRPVGRVVDAPALHAHARVAAAGLLRLLDDDCGCGVGVGVGAGGADGIFGAEEGLVDGGGVVLACGGVWFFDLIVLFD